MARTPGLCVEGWSLRAWDALQGHPRGHDRLEIDALSSAFIGARCCAARRTATSASTAISSSLACSARSVSIPHQNDVVLILYPDTNALHADPFMRRPLSQKLLAALLAEHVEVALSPVVAAEINRQVQEAADGVASGIRGTIKDLDRTYGIAAAELTPAMAPFIERIEGMARRPLGPLLAHSACNVLQWPRVESEELVTRELDGVCRRSSGTARRSGCATP